jgi:ketose-bisphosphate aldolase
MYPISNYLKTTAELLEDAKKRKYAVPMVNVTDMEFLKAVLDVAFEEKSPVIVGIASPYFEACDQNLLECYIYYSMKRARTPYAIHLDHGRTVQQIVRAIKLGFTSVMIDASYLPFEKNVEMTRKIVQLAHPFNVSVEGELGRIRGEEFGLSTQSSDYEELTDPEKAREFVQATEIDILSVSVGTVHGMEYRHKVRVEVPLVKRIAEKTSIPLALHGSFKAPDEAIKQAVEAGICKVNLALHFWEPFTNGVKEALQTKEEIVPLERILESGWKSVREEIRYRMRLLGSSGKA